jgi:predicted CXXCH cytochrome family protein
MLRRAFIVLLFSGACTMIAQVTPAKVCSTCHPKETARFLNSPMGRSVGGPEMLAGGRVAHAESGSVLTAEYRKGKLFHVLSERGETAAYPVAFQIGRGVKARSYAVQVGDYLLESPLTWYRASGWDVSPGYESMQLVDFDRPVTDNCLFCHADRAKATDADGRRVPGAAVASISCDRCHGAAEDHVRHPNAKNIVNPAKLSGVTRDSVCEQCHLEGETRVLNPGKTQWDYRPGDKLENTLVTFVMNDAAGVVNQVEELAQSKCARAPGGKMWCGTCHSAHGVPAADRNAQLTAVCRSCHASISQEAHRAGTATACVSCHMPARPANQVAHLAVTDHRLRVTKEPDRQQSLTAWREPPVEFRDRDRALAGLRIAAEKNRPEMAAASLKLLDSLPPALQESDPDVLSSLEVLFLGTSTPEKAVTLSRWALETAPESATFAMNYGAALMRAGKLPDAEREFLRAMQLDPSLMQAAAQLAVLYDREGRSAESKAVIERFRKWNPQNIQFRLAHKP